jgi:ABC-type transport system involved in multi-copper enzyme maturation permease subunit
MKRIIKNEFQKFFKSRKNIIIIILFFTYVLGMNFYNLKQYNLYMKETAETYRSRYMQADGIFGQNALRLEKDENLTDKEREELEEEMEFYRVERNKLMLISQTYEEDNKEKFYYVLIAENDRYKNILKGLEDEIIEKGFLKEKGLNMEEIHKKMHINQYMLDNDIQPILNPYTMTGANSLIMFLDGENLLILIFLIALLSIDIYLSEIEEGSYKLAYSQPFERKQIFLGKVIVIIIVIYHTHKFLF